MTSEPRYWTRAIALTGVPKPVEVPLSDAMLMSLLDALENRGPVVRSRARSSGAAKVASQQPTHSPVAAPAPSAPASPATAIEDVEESLIRELASSLRPQRS